MACKLKELCLIHAIVVTQDAAAQLIRIFYSFTFLSQTARTIAVLPPFRLLFFICMYNFSQPLPTIESWNFFAYSSSSCRARPRFHSPPHTLWPLARISLLHGWRILALSWNVALPAAVLRKVCCKFTTNFLANSEMNVSRKFRRV